MTAINLDGVEVPDVNTIHFKVKKNKTGQFLDLCVIPFRTAFYDLSLFAKDDENSDFVEVIIHVEDPNGIYRIGVNREGAGRRFIYVGLVNGEIYEYEHADVQDYTTPVSGVPLNHEVINALGAFQGDVTNARDIPPGFEAKLLGRQISVF